MSVSPIPASFFFLPCSHYWMAWWQEKKTSQNHISIQAKVQVYVCDEFRLKKSKMWCMISKCIILPRQSRNTIQVHRVGSAREGGQQGLCPAISMNSELKGQELMRSDEMMMMFFFSFFFFSCPPLTNISVLVVGNRGGEVEREGFRGRGHVYP